MGLEGSVSSSRLYCVYIPQNVIIWSLVEIVWLLLKGQDFLVTEAFFVLGEREIRKIEVEDTQLLFQ